MRKLLEIGGVIAGVVLVAFGVAAIYMGVDGRATVRDSIKQEQIVFGAADDPAVAKYASQWAEEPLRTGTQARAFAQIMHEHALEASGGLAYAQMGRFVSADDPENPAGTSDETAALMDEQGNPVSNAARNTWVTATALSTALNMSLHGRADGPVRNRGRNRAPAERDWLHHPGSRRRIAQPRNREGSGCKQDHAATSGRRDRLKRVSCPKHRGRLRPPLVF